MGCCRTESYSSGATSRLKDKRAGAGVPKQACTETWDACPLHSRSRQGRRLCASAHAQTQRRLTSWDHNSQSAARPRLRPGQAVRSQYAGANIAAPRARTTMPRVLPALAAASTKMAGSKCGAVGARGAGETRTDPGGVGAGRAPRSHRGGGGVRARGGRRGQKGVPPGQGWREKVRGHRGYPLQG